MTVELRTAGPRTGASAGDPTARSRELRDASRRFDEALMAARREGRGSLAVPGRRDSAAANPLRPEQPGSVRARSDLLNDPSSAPLAGTPAPPACEVAAANAVAALRAAVRALPPEIEAARRHDGARLALTLGTALGVDLRAGAAGVEVTLRPAPALERAAAAELPALVAALRARGVRVARAGVAPSGRRPPGSCDRLAR